MAEIPANIQRAREQWRYRGQERPPFAEPVDDTQESVWDYPRPPRIEIDSRQVIVRYCDTLVAETIQAFRVLETASPPCFYVPRQAISDGVLVRSPGSSFCEWKGSAQWWSIVLPDRTKLLNAAWSYEEPFEGFERIAGFVSFYPALVECYVQGIRVQPQPGRFYGGWVTPEVVGPFKGLPGTESW
ncbi:DUF427 domain-containing protein [Bythopirellula polymerisocia]|uniref:DUF427 domain-containing protein n=1 Tax=Bythopirellula polymerisocia TaxID=2528003 RepID=A0A5C6CIY4_9BACT|nr:hypothetical protein Pla144_41900 [Bythopirellula polymerisocia]